DGAARADVGELEAAGGGLHDVGRHAEREAVRAARLDELAQAGAVDELHHEEDVVALAREIEDAHDVAVLHADEELGFLDQAVDEDLVVGELGEQALDRDGLLKAVITDRVAGEHLGHAAAAEEVAKDVPASGALCVDGGTHPTCCSSACHELTSCNGCTAI